MKLLMCFVFFAFLTQVSFSIDNVKLNYITLNKIDYKLVLQNKKEKRVKKFGEDAYNEFKEKEKEFKDLVKDIVFPEFIEKYTDLDFVIAKDFKITCKYVYKF